MRIDLGKIKMTWKGNFDENTYYEKDDIVHYGGSAYIFVSEDIAKGVQPNPSPGKDKVWELMAGGISNPSVAIGRQGGVLVQGAEGSEFIEPGEKGSYLMSRGEGANPVWRCVKEGLKIRTLPNMDCNSAGELFSGAVSEDGGMLLWGKGDYGVFGIGGMPSQLRFGRRFSEISLGSSGAARSAHYPVMPCFPFSEQKEIVQWRILDNANVCLLSDGSLYKWGYSGVLDPMADRIYYNFPQRVGDEQERYVGFDWGRKRYQDRNFIGVFWSDTGKLYSEVSVRYRQDSLGEMDNSGPPYKMGFYIIKNISHIGNDCSQAISMGCGSSFQVLVLHRDGRISLYSNMKQGPFQSYFCSSPKELPHDGKAVFISANEIIPKTRERSQGHVLALLDNGQVTGWGSNFYGQLGHPSRRTVISPEIIEALGNDNRAVQTWGRGEVGGSIVHKQDGTVRVFGCNAYSQLGLIGSSPQVKMPVEPDLTKGKGRVKQWLFLDSLAVGDVAVVALFESGDVWVMGYNSNYNLGLGHCDDVSTPQKLKVPEKIKAVCPVGVGGCVSFGMLSESGSYYGLQPYDSDSFRRTVRVPCKVWI